MKNKLINPNRIEAESYARRLISYGVGVNHAIDAVANICFLSPSEKDDLRAKISAEIKKAA